jgi:peptidoglycan/LPS O-acetylase OafA/YrhL
MMPGRTLHRLARALCARDTCERVIDAFLADLQREWADAETCWRRASVIVRGYPSFGIALAGCLAHDAQRDPAGFTMRVLNRVAFPTVIVGLLLVGFGGPSWVKTGRVDWADAVRGMGSMSGLIVPILIARYRFRNADRRAFRTFAMAVCLAVAIVIVQRFDPGHQTAYRWLLQASISMSWAVLVRRQPGHAPSG